MGLNGVYGYKDLKNDEIIYVGKDSYIHINSRHKHHINPKNVNEQRINQRLLSDLDRYEYIVFIKGNYTDEELNTYETMLIRHFNTFYDSKKCNWTKGGDGLKGIKRPKHSELMKGKNNPRYINYPRIVKAGKVYDCKSNKKIQRYGIWFDSKLLCVSKNINVLKNKLEKYFETNDLDVFKYEGVCDKYGGVEAIRKKKQEGYSLIKLAQEIGCEYPSICSYLKRRNLKWEGL